jgi:hypothetical protein
MLARFLSRRLRIAAIATGLVAFVASAYAFRMAHKTTTPPIPTLPQAYERALEALGGQTNAFYCLHADAQSISESAGPTEWHLWFWATNGQFREVVVRTSVKVIFRDLLPDQFY